MIETGNNGTLIAVVGQYYTIYYGKSILEDLPFDVYRVQNKVYGVTEHETLLLPEAYVWAYKLEESIQKIMDSLGQQDEIGKTIREIEADMEDFTLPVGSYGKDKKRMN